jgi:hypothetical protein
VTICEKYQCYGARAFHKQSSEGCSCDLFLTIDDSDDAGV